MPFRDLRFTRARARVAFVALATTAGISFVLQGCAHQAATPPTGITRPVEPISADAAQDGASSASVSEPPSEREQSFEERQRSERAALVRRMEERAEAIRTFLRTHPELRTIDHRVAYGLRVTRIATESGENVCLAREDGPRVCWNPPRDVGRFVGSHVVQKSEVSTEVVVVFADDERLHRFAVRVPDGTIARAREAIPRARRATPRPAWAPGPFRPLRRPHWAGFEPIEPSAPSVDLGPLSGAEITSFADDVGFEVAWAIDEDDDLGAAVAHVVCVRDEAWKCGPPRLEEDMLYLIDAYGPLEWLENAVESPRYAIAHHQRLEDGGVGEGSGGTGDWTLSILRANDTDLTHVATIMLGEMQWQHRSREVGNDVRHWRVLARGHVSARPVGASCIAIDRPETFVGNADGAYVGTRRSTRLATVHVVRAPDVVAFATLDRGWPGELPKPTSAWTTEPRVGSEEEAPRAEASASDDLDDGPLPTVTVLDWSGVWHIDEDRFVRATEASCHRGATH